MVQGWLQERQYTTPYHWRQKPSDEHEYQLRTRIVLELTGLSDTARSSARLLDVGCGDARFAADAARAADTIGVDVSRRALGFACALVPSAAFVAAGGASLPFASESFDIVTLLDVIEHVSDADEQCVIAEARRVLRPGGRLVVSTNSDRSTCELKHYRHYPLERFRSLFDGFGSVRLEGLIPYFPTLRFWMALPVVWRCMRSRIRRCTPKTAHVIIGAGSKT